MLKGCVACSSYGKSVKYSEGDAGSGHVLTVRSRPQDLNLVGFEARSIFKSANQPYVFRRPPSNSRSCLRDLKSVTAAASASAAGTWPNPTDANGPPIGAPAQQGTPLIQDIFGGLTASIVALPLALAFGVASGLGPLAGLYGSIFCGFFAALLGGTPSQITGPTGPMTVVTAGIVTQFVRLGKPNMVFTVVMMAGVIQVALGKLKLGSYVRLVPQPVTSGFMSGVGVIILSTQWLSLVGASPVSTTAAALQQAGAALANVNMHALFVGSLSLLLTVCTPPAVARIVPGSLIGLVVGTATAYFNHLNVPCLGSIPFGLPSPLMPMATLELFPTMMASAMVLAVLGSIDSLLTSLVADSLTGNYHDSEKELVGQGVGNIMSGLFGGVAGAGATVRTVVNVKAGGRSRLSGMMHSVILLAIVLGLGRLAGHIPLACLGGLLMKSGWDVLDLPYLARIKQLPKESVVVMTLVLFMTVFVDLIAAVAAGVALMSLLYVRDTAEVMMSHCNMLTSKTDDSSREMQQLLSPQERRLIKSSQGRIAIFMLEGSFAFGAANGLLRKMVPSLETFETTVLDLTDTDAMDDTAALAVEELLTKSSSLGRQLYICGAGAKVLAMFDRLGMVSGMRQPPNTSREATLQSIVVPLAAS